MLFSIDHPDTGLVLLYSKLMNTALDWQLSPNVASIILEESCELHFDKEGNFRPIIILVQIQLKNTEFIRIYVTEIAFLHKYVKSYIEK